MSIFKKLQSGQPLTAEEWKDYLIYFHATPGLTPAAFKNFRTIDGKNSYEILAETVPSESDSILDLACGDGHLAQYVLPRLKAHGKYFGVDMAEGELEAARANVRDTRAEFIRAEAQSLPLKEKSVDHVLCHMAFMLMLPIGPVIREIRRVLKPGGTFSAIVPAPADDDFLIAVRRICLDFVKSRFPGVENILAGHSYQPPQAKTQEIHLEIHSNPDGVWTMMRNMYYVSFLEPKDKEELKNKVLEFARKHAKFGRHLHFEFAMRMFTTQDV